MNKTIPNSVAERVLEIRNELKAKNQLEFAKWCGRDSKVSVSNWENGKNPPDDTSLKNLQKKKNVNPDYILYGKKPKFVKYIVQDAQTKGSTTGTVNDGDISSIRGVGYQISVDSIILQLNNLLPKESHQVLSKLIKAAKERQLNQQQLQSLETIIDSFNEKKHNQD